MGTEEIKPKRSRYTPWIMGGMVLILFVGLILLQSSNVWKSLPVQGTGDALAFYALSSLNFVAFVIFAFIFIRNILKLRRERKALLIGSKIKSRLLGYFVGLSLLPIIAMAVFSYLFMNRAIERWFSDIPKTTIIKTGDKLKNRADENETQRLNETVKMLALTLADENTTSSELARIMERGNLIHIEIISPSGETEAQAQKNIGDEQKAALLESLRTIRQGNDGVLLLPNANRLEVAIATLTDGRRLLIVPDTQPESNIDEIIKNSLVEFDELKTQDRVVRQIGFSTLGLLTFLLIFASSWTAFYVARGLTTPIKALAEGADELAKGNFAHRVDVYAEDELALLVSTFNQMSSRLESNSAELFERRKYIETVLQSLSTGVISFDAENRVTTINKAAIQMFKLEDANFEGFELSSLLGTENKAIIEKLVTRAKRIGLATEQTVLQREHADGSSESGEGIPVALTASALPASADGMSAGVVVVIEDLTELISAQRASAWQEVARRMAHEIKNPLTPIQLSAERILKRYDLETGRLRHPDGEENGQGRRRSDGRQFSKVIDESTETILREVSSLKSMVDAFAQFARLPNAKFESGSVNKIIEQAILLYEDRHDDVVIYTDLERKLPETMIDAEQLRRVFVNLIENALEAFDAGQIDKKITVTTTFDSARDLVVTEISDNGTGISDNEIPKLFQPYFSTKGRGTGLGLAIVHRIVVEHGGKIRAASNLPKGAKFVIELPANV